jgi:integrase
MKLRISFHLKSGVIGEAPIIAQLNFGYKEIDILKDATIYKPLRYYTGLKCEAHEWDRKNKLPFNTAKIGELHEIKKKIEEIFNFLKFQGEVTNDDFKQALDEKLKGKDAKKVVKRVRLVDFIHSEIIHGKTNLKPRTLKSYSVFANKLIEFEQKIGRQLHTNDINEEVYKAFIAHEKSKAGKINTVWSADKSFKAVLREIGRRYKLNIFDPGKELGPMDRVQKINEDKVYLNFEQIQKIIDYQPETEKLRNTKLLLLVLLFTGCRESDVYKIIPDQIYSKNDLTFRWTRYVSQKTNMEIIVPILKPLMDALEANDWNPPYQISAQNFNIYVKELARLSGLDEEVTLTYTDPHGRKQFETKPLYQFVSSHIGRRSFVTNLINYVPITILTKITGHTLKDKSIIFGYNKVSLLDNAAMFVRELRRVEKEYPEHFVVNLI